MKSKKTIAFAALLITAGPAAFAQGPEIGIYRKDDGTTLMVTRNGEGGEMTLRGGNCYISGRVKYFPPNSAGLLPTQQSDQCRVLVMFDKDRSQAKVRPENCQASCGDGGDKPVAGDFRVSSVFDWPAGSPSLLSVGPTPGALDYKGIIKALQAGNGQEQRTAPLLIGKTLTVSLRASRNNGFFTARKDDDLVFECASRSPGFKSGTVTSKISNFFPGEGDSGMFIVLERCGG